MDIRSAIRFAADEFKRKGMTSALLDAEVLLLETLNASEHTSIDKAWLYLHAQDHALSPDEEKIFRSFIARRKKLEPIAYITGKKEFYGLDFSVNKDVLIPRPETELIVSEALGIIAHAEGRPTIIDIGTGSGCIPISIIKSAAGSGIAGKIGRVYADDISEKALETARENARRHQVSSRITFLHSDLEEALEKTKNAGHLIVTANLPYITPEDHKRLSPNVKSYEPRLALVAEEKGLYHIRRLISKFALSRSATMTYALLLEADPRQMRSIASIARKELPDAKMETIRDLRGKKRMMKISNDTFPHPASS